MKKRFYTENSKGKDFDIVKCDPKNLGLEDGYVFEGKKNDYVSIEGKLDDSLEYPAFVIADLGGNTYFACDDDFFNKKDGKVIFTFRTEDINKLNNIDYYLVYKK